MRERAASDERETETVDSGIEININQPRGKLMEARFNYAKTAPEAYKAMLGLEQYLRECGLEESLLRLVKARASQINGCAYCLDIHWKDLRAMGESEQRLYSLDAWRECPFYTDRERAALRWAEAVTLITSGHVTDEFMRRRDCASVSTNCRI
jgi:AhpD family alkylhydroperoxidase